MTREQRKRCRRLEAAAWVVGFLALIAVLCVSANAAFNAEVMKTDLAVTGAFVWAWGIMRVVLWLDTPRGKRNG